MISFLQHKVRSSHTLHFTSSPPPNLAHCFQGCSPTTLKEIAGQFIAMSWNHFFPEGSEGDAVMRQLPSSLWESILPHFSIISMGSSPSLADALARVKSVCDQEEDICGCLKGILLHEWHDSAWLPAFDPDRLISLMSEGRCLLSRL